MTETDKCELWLLSLVTLSSPPLRLLLSLRRSIGDRKRQLRGGFAGNAHPRAKDLNNEKPPKRGLYFYKTSPKVARSSLFKQHALWGAPGL